MNILILTSIYPYEKYPKANGTKVVEYFAKSWVKMGHRVVVIVDSTRFPKSVYKIAKYAKKIISKKYDIISEDIGNDSWSNSFVFENEGVIVANFPMLKLCPGGRFGSREIQKQVKIIQTFLDQQSFIPDVMTGHWMNPQLPLLVELKKIYPVKGSIVIHGDYSKKRIKRINANKLIRNIDHVGFRSGSAIRETSSFLQTTEEPFVCASGLPDEYIDIYGGKTEHIFNPYGLSIVSVGRLVKYKCFDSVINALANAKTTNMSLVIIGSGDELENLKQLSIEKNIEDKVSFTGKIDRDRVQSILSKKDVFVLISRKETFGLVYLEAMLQGCIVVASRFGGVDGIIIDGYNGFLCEEGNSDELAHILDKIALLSKKDKEDISKNAIKTALMYSDTKVANNYLLNISK